MTSALPNLLVIGAMKAGTTSLHDYLRRHPDIFMSQVKELDFFVKERRWGLGVEWYRQQFDGRFQLRGESSQNYTKRHYFDSGIATRIASLMPDVRLIYIVRDPVERIVSHYHEAVEGGYAPAEGLNAFLSADVANNHYVRTSSYFYQLEPYLRLFKRNQIHVLALEDLMDNRLVAMNHILEFLGATTVSDGSIFDFARNTGTEKRVRNVIGRVAFGSICAPIRAAVPRRCKDAIKNSSLSRRLMTTPIDREQLDESLANRIRDVLRSDIDRLRGYTGLRFERWSL